MQNQTKYLFILISQISCKQGKPLAEQSFDAWGRYRNPETWEILSPDAARLLSFVEVNGRLYDPVLGRMLSPDNYIQLPDYTQNFNRYSYVLNNPLKYRDPSGEFAWGVFAVGAIIGGIQGHIMAFKAGYGLGDWQFWAYGVVGSTVGGFSAVAGNWASNMTQALGAIPGAIVGAGTGAVVGGATSVVQGGLINVIEGNSFGATWEKDLISGATSGAIFGAVSGGGAGYKRAKAVGANRWTGEGYGKTHWKYQVPLKSGIPLNPDEEGYCYAYEGEYADQGHLNRGHEEFMAAAKNNKGTDMKTLWDNMNTEGRYSVYGADASDIAEYHNSNWKSLGQYELTNPEKEIGLAIKSMSSSGGHAVNLTGIEYIEKYRIFGGGTKNVLYFNYWDPSKGFLTRQSITILQIIVRTYR